MLLAKYGESFTFHSPIIKAGEVNHAGSGDWTPAAGDVKVSKDEGTQANVGTLPTFSNGEWKWTLSATEMQAAKVYLKTVDSATKAVEDQAFIITTFGHASAHIKADLNEVGAGQRLAVDVEAVSGDTTAADNLESACDNYSATRGLAGTALPNAAADAAGGLPTSDAGGLDMDGLSTFDHTANTVTLASATHTGAVIPTVTTLTNLPSIPANWLTAAGIAAGALNGKGDWNTTTPPTAASIRTEIDSNSTQLALILADTNELQTDDVPGLISALNDISAADILTTALTESYAADGSAPTLTQAVLLALQHLSESSISGTTKTVKRLDGSTTAATFTLDDASTPTSITRAT